MQVEPCPCGRAAEGCYRVSVGGIPRPACEGCWLAATAAGHYAGSPPRHAAYRRPYKPDPPPKQSTGRIYYRGPNRD